MRLWPSLIASEAQVILDVLFSRLMRRNQSRNAQSTVKNQTLRNSLHLRSHFRPKKFRKELV